MTKKNLNFRIHALHPKALLLEWDQEPSEALLAFLLSFQIILEKQVKVTRCTMGYQSLLVHLLVDMKSLAWWKQRLMELQPKVENKTVNKGRHWKIPVCYEPEYAPDLLALAEAVQLKPEEVVQLHTQTRYRVYFLGFLPGFLYLNGLDKRLYCPRKEKPLLKVPKGAVGIGGMQTGIYPSSSPGGWHLVGTTPLSLFDAQQQPPCFATAGDWISFESIDSKNYKALQKKINQGTFKFKSHD